MPHPTRHLLVQESMHAEAAARAGELGVSLSDFVRAALDDWVSDLDVVRLTADPDRETPPVSLSESARADLEWVALDPSGRMLGVYLALLAEARWPVVAVVEPVLGMPQQKITALITQGRKMLESGEADRVIGRIPPVPDAPEAAQRFLTGEEMVGLTLQAPAALMELVNEKAELQRVSLSQAVREALHAALSGPSV